MVGAIGTGRGGRTAVAELGAGRIAEGPTAHRLLQFDDRNPERHRHDDALERLRLSLGKRLRGDRERGCAPRDPRGRRGQAPRRGALRGWRRRRPAGTRDAQIRRFGAARQAKAMDLSDHGVAGKAIAEQTRDLRLRSYPPSNAASAARLSRPSKTSSPRSSVPYWRKAQHAYAESGPLAWRKPVGRKRGPALALRPSPRHLVALNPKTTLLVESRKSPSGLLDGLFHRSSLIGAVRGARPIRLRESHQGLNAPMHAFARGEAENRFGLASPFDQIERLPYSSTRIRQPPQRGGVFISRPCAPTVGSQNLEPAEGVGQVNTAARDFRHRPHLRAGQCRIRARRGLLARVDDRGALSRFRRRHRRDLGRPRPSPPRRNPGQPGLEAVARLEPLSESRGRALRAPSHRGDLRRPRLFRQLGRARPTRRR